MHVVDLDKGIIGANGIVGGGIAISTGAALAARLDGKGQVVVCFFGDGAANQGVLMESMNMAAIWKLPIMFVCENNGVGEFTLSASVTAGKLVDRARAVMPAVEIDGNDIPAVLAAARQATARARAGEGPTFIEAHTFRIHGHVEGEEGFLGGGGYRSFEEVAAWQADERDPIARFKAFATGLDLIVAADVEALSAELDALIEDAVAYAEAGEPADPALVFKLYDEQVN